MDDKRQAEPSIPTHCLACKARHDGMCSVLDAAELALLSSHTRHTRHAAGETIAVESDIVDGYANVVEGVVKLSRVLQDGRQQLVGLQFAPDLVGRLFGRENLLTAEAASPVALCRVPRPILEALVARSGALERRLLDQALADLDQAREWLVTLGRKTAGERVASLLLMIAERSLPAGEAEPVGPVTFELPLGRGDMADFLGLTIETVSRQISRLRREGVIEVAHHRDITVASLERLRRRGG